MKKLLFIEKFSLIILFLLSFAYSASSQSLLNFEDPTDVNEVVVETDNNEANTKDFSLLKSKADLRYENWLDTTLILYKNKYQEWTADRNRKFPVESNREKGWANDRKKDLAEKLAKNNEWLIDELKDGLLVWQKDVASLLKKYKPNDYSEQQFDSEFNEKESMVDATKKEGDEQISKFRNMKLERKQGSWCLVSS